LDIEDKSKQLSYIYISSGYFPFKSASYPFI